MSKDEELRVKNLLEKYDIPTTYKIKDVEDFYEHFFLDKKSLDNKIKFILPMGLGDCKITNEITKNDVIQILKGFKLIKKILILVLFLAFVLQKKKHPLSTTSSVVVDKRQSWSQNKSKKDYKEKIWWSSKELELKRKQITRP